MSELRIPELSLVVLVGASGSGKSTFAAKHFAPTEVLSSDFFRGMVCDDPAEQSVSAEAFAALHYVAGRRLSIGRLTVIDATNVQRSARRELIRIAREHHVVPVAIVLDVPAERCIARNAARTERSFGPHVVQLHRSQLEKSLDGLEEEGFRHVWVLSTQEEIDAAAVVRTRMPSDLRDHPGPFDVIGDVHGCAEELRALLRELGWVPDEHGVHRHPAGRTAVFLGDLVDRGPSTPDALRIAMAMVGAGTALCVQGNHEAKLLRKLNGRQVKMSHGLAQSWAQLEREPAAFREEVRAFIEGLVSHYELDAGRLVVAHAGLVESMHGRSSGRVRQFCLYGETTGESDDLGLPIRLDWARDYRGDAAVVYGHTPTAEARWRNNTICIDTGCVFGGQLSALRWPERELVSVPARAVHYTPVRALAAEPERPRDLLEIGDVAGDREIETRYGDPVAVREENAAAALEVMSRFAADPRWLVYLPPTVSPPEASALPDVLEHPREAFAYYLDRGVAEVVCEQMHPGERAVLVVCRDEGVGRARFGPERLGAVFTRTGRPFFAGDEALERALLAEVRDALVGAGVFEAIASGWVVLDAAIAPGSATTDSLLRAQHAPLAAAGSHALSAAVALLERRAGVDAAARALLERSRRRADDVAAFIAGYERLGSPHGLEGLSLAPFHLLASEGHVHVDRGHAWHMEMLGPLAREAQRIVAVEWRTVPAGDPGAVEDAVRWWEALVGAGSDGMVVKPAGWLARHEGALVQPALKVRGPEPLRVSLGPEYRAHLPALRKRALSVERRLAVREYALGLEALARFVDHEPLYRVHECVFGVLALEATPVDPRR